MPTQAVIHTAAAVLASAASGEIPAAAALWWIKACATARARMMTAAVTLACWTWRRVRLATKGGKGEAGLVLLARVRQEE